VPVRRVYARHARAVLTGEMATATGGSTSRTDLVRLLQAAHAGELAAAYAYRGHWKAVRREAERIELQRIEAAEWHHRKLVGEILTGLGEQPSMIRERIMGAVGRFFGLLCFVPFWFGPMYAAGRLEAMNVGQYARARDLARSLGHEESALALEEMRIEEARHEQWFGEQVTGHRLLRPAQFLFRWNPANSSLP
jgi:demethoxyubiquinone hydroxylase (CLK1/Coq7/Cat5 family)